MTDVYFNMDTAWNSKYVVPVGEPAPGNSSRFSDRTISDLLDKMAGLTSDDPNIVPMTEEFMKAWVSQMPWIPMFGTSNSSRRTRTIGPASQPRQLLRRAVVVVVVVQVHDG